MHTSWSSLLATSSWLRWCWKWPEHCDCNHGTITWSGLHFPPFSPEEQMSPYMAQSNAGQNPPMQPLWLCTDGPLHQSQIAMHRHPPCFKLDHWALKLQVHGATLKTHCHYLHNWSQLPAVTPRQDESGPNNLFTRLLEFHKQPMPLTYSMQDEWIASDMRALIDQCNAALQCLVL